MSDDGQQNQASPQWPQPQQGAPLPGTPDQPERSPGAWQDPGAPIATGWQGAPTALGWRASGAGDARDTARRRRTGLLLGLIGGGVLVLGLFAGVGMWSVSEYNAHTPQAAARPYLEALVSGNVADIKRLGHISTTSPLVTQDAYSETNGHITAFSARTAARDSTSAQVTVTYTQDGSRHSELLSMKRVGTDLLLFPKWRLEPVTLPSVRVDLSAPKGAGVTVNGIAVGSESGGTALVSVLPGDYTVGIGENPDYTATEQSVTVSNLTAPSNASEKSVSLTATLTDAGSKAAIAATNAWVASCIAQPTYAPAGCSFGLVNDHPEYHLSNQKWTLVTAPDVAIGAWAEEGGGWLVTTTSPGEATYRADLSTDNGRYGEMYSVDPLKVKVAGVVTGFDAHGRATFRSIPWVIQAPAASA